METRRDARPLPWRRGFQPRPHPRRWSFQLRHNDAARRRISLNRHLLQYVTGRAKASIMMKLRRFTKRLRYRCGRCFANFNRSHPTRRGVLSMETRLPAASLPSCDAHLPRDNYGDILHHFQLSSRRHYLIDARCCRPSSA